eukprot:7511694-Alexandrium_andersonii.AAC.1
MSRDRQDPARAARSQLKFRPTAYGLPLMSTAASPAVSDKHCQVDYHTSCDPTPHATPPIHCNGGRRKEKETTHAGQTEHTAGWDS